MAFFVCILAARKNGAIYIGRSTDLRKRVEQHRLGEVAAHTRRYGIYTLVYFELHDTLESMIIRERRLKRWKRVWKDELIESVNPEWCDLTDQIPL